MIGDVNRIQRGLTRRRFLTISAAAALLPGPARADAPTARWTGFALGAQASMALVGVDDGAARAVFAAVEAELDRLEGLFSLYRKGSTLDRLNRTGWLETPPADFLHLVRLADRLHHATGGAFDPTVQPLWQRAAQAAAEGKPLSGAALTAARRLTGWRNVRFSDRSVRFARAGMAITFNGIAQGFIADRVADLLWNRGLRNVLIDMGEIVALGHRPDGANWRAGIAAPDGTLVAQVTLRDRALATSAPLGTLMDDAGRVGHILDPKTGLPGKRWRLVSVSASTATLADGLSTAFCLMPRAEIDAVIADYPEADIAALT